MVDRIRRWTPVITLTMGPGHAGKDCRFEHAADRRFVRTGQLFV
jgi:hypothetical protein